MKKLLFFLLLGLALTGFSQSKKDKLVKISTPHGEMVVVLYDDTPLHKANFIELAESGKYDSTIFHRVMEDFMIQGGDIFRKPGAERGGDSDKLEAEIRDHLFHKKGELAAARQPDRVNPDKKSSNCQFYIVQGKVYDREELTIDQNKLNKLFAELMQAGKIDSIRNDLLEMQKEKRFDEMNDYITACAPYLEEVSGESVRKDNDMTPEQVDAYSTVGGTPFLDGEYTVFGRVLTGMEVIDKIAAVKVGGGNLPDEEIHMTMEVMELKKKKITKLYGYTYD